MPRLSDEERQRIHASLEAHERIRASLPQYVSHHCYLCNWASNGLTFDEAREANAKHIANMHASEDTEWHQTEVSMNSIADSFHDHDCIMGHCACKCGCTRGPFCQLVMGSLCPDCMIAEGRGHEEHGIKEPQ